MIELKKLGEEEAESVSRMIEAMYLEGNCYEFALGIHRDTGLPIIGLVNDGTVWHVGIRYTDGRFFDARGFVEESEIEVPFRKQGPFEIRIVAIDELLASREISGEGAARASMLVQALHPDFPWRESVLINRIRLFMEALEGLCKTHGLMIRAPFQTTRPIIDVAYGDEKGFSMSPIPIGGGYFFDRVL